MTNKIKVYWCMGTGYPFLGMANAADITDIVEADFVPGKSVVVGGLNGKTAIGHPKAGPPMGQLLDADIFEFEPVLYPAAIVGMGPAIATGVDNVAAKITDPNRPKDQKFMLVGISQGAAVMSGIYNRLRYGDLSSYNSQFIGGTMFGNPRRQQNYRGEVGGTWSGCWDILNSSTAGHGCFPTTGPYARLQNCESNRWIELVYPNDIFSAVGDSDVGSNWQTAVAAWLTNTPLEFASYINLFNALPILNAVKTAFLDIASQNVVFTDAIGQVVNWGSTLGGHNTPYVVPIDNPDNGLTQLQIALKWMHAKAADYAIASIVAPTAKSGWSTSLIAPAA